MAIKEYAGGAAPSTITVSINSSASSVSATDLTNWPTGATGNFWCVINPGLSNEEKIRCASRSGNTLNFASGGRGGDGTTATSHDPPAVIMHVGVAEDFREANDHVFDITNDDHTQYLNVTRHDSTARHTPGSVIPASSIVADLAGDADPGIASAFSLGDHKHGLGAWSTYTPAPSGIFGAQWTLGNGTITGKYLRVGDALLGLHIYFSFQSTSTISGAWGCTLPSGLSAPNNTYIPALYHFAGNTISGLAWLGGAMVALVWLPDNSPTTVQNSPLSDTFPEAWVAGNELTITFGIELS